jgi:hypothetical protein
LQLPPPKKIEKSRFFLVADPDNPYLCHPKKRLPGKKATPRRLRETN